MKLRWTLFLLILNVLLIGVFARSWSHPASVRAFEKISRNFLPLERGDWEAVAISSEAMEWKAARDRWGQWWLKSPVEWPARTDKMAKMMGSLLGLKVDSSFSVSDLKRVGQNLRSYGLEVPRAVLTVSSAGAAHTYKIGSVTPLGGKLYVLSPDEKEIWVVDGSLGEYIGWSFETLRQDRFYPFEVAELEGVQTQLGDQSMSFSRSTATGEWVWSVDDKTLPTEGGIVDQWIVDVGAIKVDKFEKLSPDAQGLRIPYGRIIFKTLYGRRALLVGAAASEATRWAQWEGAKTAFEVNNAVFDRLALTALLPAHPFAFHTDEVKGVEVVLPKNSWKIQKLENASWVCEGKVLDSEKVLMWLTNLAKTQGVAQKTAAILSAPYKIQVQTAQGLQVLNVGADLRTASLPGVAAGYRLTQAVEDTAVSDFWDLHFLPAIDLAGTTVEWVDLKTGLTRVIGKETPELAALSVLVKDAQVQSWVGQARPESDFAYRLHIGREGVTTTVLALKTPEGWVGQVNAECFKFDQPWVSWLETICKLPQQ